MNVRRKHLARFVFGYVSILMLVLASLAGILSASAAPLAATISEGNVTLMGGFQAGNFPAIWDPAACDMTISFTYDGNGLSDAGGAHAWSELGIRGTTAGNFNPNGQGVWLATDYDYTAGTFAPDPVGAPTLDMDDKLTLQKQSGQGEGAYNLPSVPPTPGNNHNFWFDRDGVDQWQAQSPLAVDGGTYNTKGLYNVDMTFHATGATTGTAYMTINGLAQGFETDGNWNTIELTPAGMTFSGDMTRMQVFYGLYGYGATHTVHFNDILVTGCLASYTVNASVTGGHGSVAPATQTVDWNTSASISISPDPGYHIATITDNGNPATIANPYVISNVTEDHTVVVTFAPTVPVTKDQCKNDGWIDLRRTDGSQFKNQGDCIQYYNTGK